MSQPTKYPNFPVRKTHHMIPLPPIEIFKNNMILHLTHGHKRVQLIQKIHKSYTRMHPAAVAHHRHKWLRDLVDRVKDKNAFDVTVSSMSLYFLWDKLLATEYEWSWLMEIKWYQAPSEEAVRGEERRSGKINKYPKLTYIPTIRQGLEMLPVVNAGHVIPFRGQKSGASSSSAHIRFCSGGAISFYNGDV